ncbi:hypothetical protein [Rubrobacter calidifluminis]|uniref:hypothetical protein n=1 Tax=Rubrobacter calidifluminis TaxID=1392640 RepID=UPI002361EFE3|nr:hypothetical protein [Rubrobacter calidifluminis]
MSKEQGHGDSLRMDRRGFIRYLGATLLAGLGVALSPEVAEAAGSCCRYDCRSCSSGRAYRCSCPGYTYCICSSSSRSCFPAAC